MYQVTEIKKKRVYKTVHLGMPTYLIMGCLLALFWDCTLYNPLTLVIIILWPVALLLKFLGLAIYLSLIAIPIILIIVLIGYFHRKMVKSAPRSQFGWNKKIR